MLRSIRRPGVGERGASALEYGLLVTLIAVVVIMGVTFFGGRVSELFNRSCTSVATATSTGACS